MQEVYYIYNKRYSSSRYKAMQQLGQPRSVIIGICIVYIYISIVF